MSPAETAYAALRALRCKGADGDEERIRRLAAQVVKEFDLTKHLVLERRVPWMPTRNRGFSQHANSDGVLGEAYDFDRYTFTVQIPGNDFGAQMVVEQQIREAVAAL